MAAPDPASAAVARLATHDVAAALARAWRLAGHGAPEALDAFDEAWRAADAQRNHSAAAEAAAAAVCLVDGNYRDFHPFATWAARLAESAAHPDGRDDPAVRLAVLGARALRALHTVDDFGGEGTIRNAVSMLREAADPDKALCGATALVLWLETARRDRDATQIEIEAERFAATAAPWFAGHWASVRGQHALFSHRLDEAEAKFRQARDIARRFDLRSIDVVATMMEARLAVARGDFDAARARLVELEPVDDEREPMWRAVAEQLRSLAELCSGHFDYALGTARRAIAFADKAAAPDDESIQMRCLEAYCLAAVNDGNAAAAAFRDAGGRASPMQSRQAMLLADMAAADALIAAGRRAEAKPFVGRALVEARSVDYPAFFWPVPDVAARVCALALESGIENDYVRSLIRERSLPPPADAPASWPWKCRVHVLGGFRVEQDGRRLATDGARASGKPTELLRAIVALGGRRVGVERLVSLLWPGEGRVGARSAFNVTLLRLRRLLGADSLVVLSEGEVSLDPRHATVDRWQLEAALAAAEVAGDDALGEALAGVVDGYPGPLLPDDGASWVEAERRRLRLRVDAVLAKGAARIARLDAASLLSRALAADRELPLAAAALRAIVAGSDHR
jgi:DNA-binding SARP family transcriptional activator